MHFVFLNQYYPPDAAPTGVVLRDLADGLLRKGHEVTILCAAGEGYAHEKFASVQPSVSSEEDGPMTQDARVEDPAPVPSPSQIQHSKSNIQNSTTPSIVRIRAFRFGRGSSLGKLLDYLSYYLGVTWKLVFMKPRPDRIVALTTPPYLSVLARAISRLRGADHAHWVMDLYPDVMVAHGMLEEEGYCHRILAGLTRWGFGGRRCAAIVTLGPDMTERVAALMSNEGRRASKNQDSESNRVSWVPLWGTGTRKAAGETQATATEETPLQAAALRKERGWSLDDLVVMYSGNMGLGHRFGEILAAAREISAYSERDQEGRPRMGANDTRQQMKGERTRMVFFGGGKRRAEVMEFVSSHPGCDVEIHDYAPASILSAHLESADVHLVSLNAEWTGTMVPSKLQGIFAVGRPVIFIGSDASCIAQWLRDSGGGWVVKPGDVAGLLTALNEARDPDERSLRGKAALAYNNHHFSRDLNVARVAELYEGIAG